MGGCSRGQYAGGWRERALNQSAASPAAPRTVRLLPWDSPLSDSVFFERSAGKEDVAFSSLAHRGSLPETRTRVTNPLDSLLS